MVGGLIYSVTFPNGKVYVGMTRQRLAVRWYRHCDDARRGSPLPMHRAIMKYGKDSAVVVEIGAANTRDALCALESSFIVELNTRVPHGYNLTAGGDGGHDRRATANSRANMSAAQKKTWQDPQVRQRRARAISVAHKRNWADPEYQDRMTAIRNSEQVCSRISESQKASWAKPEKKVRMRISLKARWADPGQHEQHSKAASRSWTNPEIRARRVAAMRAHYAAKGVSAHA